MLRNAASVKDAIEAVGVPHVEVAKIVTGGHEKDFNYLLQPEDRIEVFPFEKSFPSEAPNSFVLDVHLGKLARLLRMMGVDALYENNRHDREIVALAVNENRTVLTRDIGLLKHKLLRYGYWLRSQQPEEQVLEVIRLFSLCDHLRPFTRCMACNGLLAEVPKAAIADRLPEQTRRCFDVFFQCTRCGKLYWKGSHFDNMEERISRIKSLAC